MPRDSLGASLLSQVSGPGSAALRDRPWLEAVIVELVHQAQAAWPEVHVEPETFVAFLAQRIDAESDLDRLAVADLYLAAACIAGQAKAIAALDRLIERACRRLRLAPADALADELCQATRLKLLLAPDGAAPKIAGYQGRGPLQAWLQVVMARQLIDLKRTVPREQPAANIEALADASATLQDPEVAFLRERHRDQFKEAFGRALQGLSDGERGVLRLHVVNGMSIDRIAICCAIGRSTAARWLATIREKLLEQTRKDMAQVLGLEEQDAASLIQALKSDFQPSISRLLGGGEK